MKIINRFDFLNLKQFTFEWELKRNGENIKNGVIDDISVFPHDTSTIQIPAVARLSDNTGETILNIYANLQESTLWAESGFTIAREQFIAESYDFSGINEFDSDMGSFKINKDSKYITVQLSDSKIRFSRKNGSLISYQKNEQEWISHPLEPYFWKVPNDNQERNGYELRLGAWYDAGKRLVVEDINIHQISEKMRQIIFHMKMPLINAEYNLIYTINADGMIQVQADYIPNENKLPPIPKFGMRMAIPESYNTIQWYGRGPHENYWDRKTSAFIGVYKKSLKSFITPYISPQDNANRCDTRWIKFLDQNGHGLCVKGLQPLSFRAWPYTEMDLKQTSHNNQLPDRNFINVNLDLKVHGVGGNNSWGKRTLPKYTLDATKSHSYGFILKVI